MSITGLPAQDVVRHNLEPHPCKRCNHSYFKSSDTEFRYLRCNRTSNMCVFERDQDGDCKPEGKHWKVRGI